jgi:alpha-tubulin suppressor-like RCC1 family protein
LDGSRADATLEEKIDGSSDGALDGGTADIPDAAGADVQVADAGARAIAISAGTVHTCALLADGSARCWGQNDYGQLGSGTTGPSNCYNDGASVPILCATRPLTVAGLAGATTISAGDYHACATLSDGTVRCWGFNDDGELGVGDAVGPSVCSPYGSPGPCSLTPVPVKSLTNARSVSASDQRSACAVLADGSVRCWGLNGGQLGTGTTDGPMTCPGGIACALAPVLALDLAGVIAVDISTFHNCALLSGGHVKCWGFNLTGQLGNGTLAESFSPVPVGNISNATAITTGALHSCALLEGGTVACWGANSLGQLGAPSSENCPGPTSPPFDIPCATKPIAVAGLSGVVAISAGASHTCALLGDGSVMCWGSNQKGQLGSGNSTGPSTCISGPAATPIPCATTPVRVLGLTGVTAISAGGVHTCAVVADGSVRCWGYNVFGQLGDGTVADSAAPVAVAW